MSFADQLANGKNIGPGLVALISTTLLSTAMLCYICSRKNAKNNNEMANGSGVVKEYEPADEEKRNSLTNNDYKSKYINGSRPTRISRINTAGQITREGSEYPDPELRSSGLGSVENSDGMCVGSV